MRMNVNHALQVELDRTDLIELAQASDRVTTIKNEGGDAPDIEISLSDGARKIVSNPR